MSVNYVLIFSSTLYFSWCMWDNILVFLFAVNQYGCCVGHWPAPSFVSIKSEIVASEFMIYYHVVSF